jgi:hypothetical protein
LKDIANAVIVDYSDLGYKNQYKKFEEKCKEEGLLEIPKLKSFHRLKNKGQQENRIEIPS